MKNQFLILNVILSCLFLSCSNDDSSISTTDMNEEVVSAGEISQKDSQLLTQIKKMSDLFDTDQIWDGYNLKEASMFLLHKNKEGIVDRGILINPLSTIEGATKLEENASAGLMAYRYDNEIQRAFQLLNSEEGNTLYDFDFKIDGKGYYIQVYTDEEVTQGEELAVYPGGFFNPDTATIGAIDFIIHENFHAYQDSWSFRKTPILDPKGVAKPMISQGVLELRTLMHQIFKDFPNGNLEQGLTEKKLRQYVAIRSKEIELDPTVVLTEKGEGSARFIEKMALRKVFPKRANEPFIPGTVLEDNYGIVNRETLEMVFDFGLLYEIGASACFGINKLDREALKRLTTGETIYDIAKSLFNMTDQELSQQLQDAKDSVDWIAIQNKVKQWETLN